MPIPLPTDLGQLKDWLIMPAVLSLIANLVINAFFSTEDSDRKNIVKFVTFLVIGVVSFLLSKLSPDFIMSLEPLWLMLVAVITAYYTPTAVRQLWFGLQLLGVRLVLGHEIAKLTYDKHLLPKPGYAKRTAHG